MQAPRPPAGMLGRRGLAMIIAAAIAVFATPIRHAQADARGGTCASLRTRSRFSPAPVDRIQRAVKEREIRACLADMPTEYPTAWSILRARDPRVFRPVASSEVQVDGVTEADIVTALDAAAGRRS